MASGQPEPSACGALTAPAWAQALSHSPTAQLITDLHFRVLACSVHWAQEAAACGCDAVGQSLFSLAPTFERWREAFDQALGGETVKLDKVAKPQADGAPGWLAVEMGPWREPDGRIGGVMVCAHDVTQAVEALEVSTRAEERLTLALEFADIHVWEMDYVGRKLIKLGNDETYFTEPKTYMELYRDVFCTIDPRDRQRVKDAWEANVRDGAPYKPEYRIMRSDDKEVWIAGAGRLITGENGKPIRIIGAMQNITDRKLAEQALLDAKEEAELANRAKSAFLATMSHEIRTPLNGVLGMAQAMAADELSDIQRERLNVVRRSGETLLAILNDILDLSKIEAGKLELEQVEFDLGELARGALAGFSAVAAGKGLALELTLDDAARGVYRGDCTRVRQILQNLISNALKFTSQGRVGVQVAPKDGGLQFVVSDTGLGIPADRLPMLFQKFEQVDASTTRRFGGTGLGLAICRQLAELFGGAIHAESVEGEGTRFIVYLPLQRLHDEREVEAAAPRAERSAAEHGALQVLAAEDNSVNQLVLKTLLNQAGVDPFIVGDGAQAVEAWREREWDLILMDVQMPVMDGPSAARRIRELERALGRGRTPIIALTANAMSHQVADYIAAGMDSFVAKPIEIERLFAAIEAALEAADEGEALEVG